MQKQLKDLHRELQQRRSEEQKLLEKVKMLTRNRRLDVTVSQALHMRNLPPTTTTTLATTIMQTASRADTPQFPYIAPKTTIMYFAPNGTELYHSLTRKVYTSMTQLPHGSVIVNGSVIYYVYWPTSDARTVRRYRKSKWDAEEGRRQGPRYIPSRSTRDLEENLLWTILATKDRFTVDEAEIFYLAFDNAENRKRFHELYKTVPAEDYYDDELTPLTFDLDIPAPNADYVASSEQYEEYEEGPSRNRRDLPNAEETTTPWDYSEDDEADKALSKKINRQHEKHEALFPSTIAKSAPTPAARGSSDADDEDASTTLSGTEQLSHNINVKNQYVTDEWNIHESEVFRQVFRRICEMDQQEIQIINTMRIWDATGAMRAYFRNQNIGAMNAGQVIAIYPCTKVIAKHIYWDQKHNGTCYAEVPVDVDGQLWFLQPGTTDLKKESRRIPCSSRRPNIFQNGTNWQSSTGHRADVSELTHQLHFERPELALELDAPALNDSDYAETVSMVSELASWTRRVNKLEDTMSRVHLRSTSSVMDSIGTALDDAKSLFNETVSNVRQTIGKWNPFDDWFSVWYHYALTILGIALAIAVILGLCYFMPVLLTCATGTRDAIQDGRRRRNLRRSQRKRTYAEFEMDGMVAAVNAADEPEQRLPDASIFQYFPKFSYYAIASRHQEAYGTVPPRTEMVTGGHKKNVTLDTAAETSACTAEFRTLAGAQLFPSQSNCIYAPTGTEIQLHGEYRSIVEISGSALTARLQVVDKHHMPEEIILGAPTIRTLNEQLGPMMLRYHQGRKQWSVNFQKKSDTGRSRSPDHRQWKLHRSPTTVEHAGVLSALRDYSGTPQPIIFTYAYLNDKPAIGRVDTAGAVSVCTATTAFRHQMQPSRERDMPTLKFMGKDNLITPIGKARIQVGLGPFQEQLHIYVVSDGDLAYMNADFFIGADWLASVTRQHTLSIDLATMEMRIAGLNVAIDSTGTGVLYKADGERRSDRSRPSDRDAKKTAEQELQQLKDRLRTAESELVRRQNRIDELYIAKNVSELTLCNEKKTQEENRDLRQRLKTTEADFAKQLDSINRYHREEFQRLKAEHADAFRILKDEHRDHNVQMK